MKRADSEKEARYWINENDPRPPLRYKESRRHHRRNKEFSRLVKREKYKIVGGKCEICNCKLSFNQAHFHHILSLSYAFHYYPQIPDEVLKSIENCQVLCEECHEDIHQQDSLLYYAAIAQNLIAILEEWEPLESPLRHEKKKKRKRDNAKKFLSAAQKSNQSKLQKQV